MLSFSVPAGPYLMCSHVSRGFLLVLVLLFLLVFVFFLFLRVKMLTTDVEELLNLQHIPRACSGAVRARKENEKASRKNLLCKYKKPQNSKEQNERQRRNNLRRSKKEVELLDSKTHTCIGTHIHQSVGKTSEWL